MNKSETFSVIISSYNYQQYINKCLDSILEQSLQPNEIIIIDDASTDESPRILKEYADKHPHIKLVLNKKNLGIANMTKKMLSYISSEYVYMHAIDDYVLPGFFEKAMEALNKHKDAVMCVFDPVFYKEETEEFTYGRHLSINKPLYIQPAQVHKYYKKNTFWIPGHSTILKASVLKAHSYLDLGVGPYSDWLTLHVMAAKYNFYYCPEALSVMRTHTQQFSSSFKLNEKIQIWTNIFEFLILPKNKPILKFFKRHGLLLHLTNGFDYKYKKRFLETIGGKVKYWKILSTQVTFQLLKAIKDEKKLRQKNITSR